MKIRFAGSRLQVVLKPSVRQGKHCKNGAIITDNRLLGRLLVTLLSLALIAGCQSSAKRVSEFDSPAIPEAVKASEQPVATAENIVQAEATQAGSQEMAQTEASETNRWTRWMERFRQPKRIPFPRTDLQQEPEPAQLVDVQQQLGEF